MKDIVGRIKLDPRYLANIEYGKPRAEHPEGRVKYHIIELEEKLEKLGPWLTDDDYWKLMFLILVHDTFKAEAVPNSPILSPNSHSSLARKFASEFTDDEDLLNMIQFHALNYLLWKQFSGTGIYDEDRLADLLALITDLDLFLHFIILDGSTNGKDKAKLTWFIGEVRKYKKIDIEEKRDL